MNQESRREDPPATEYDPVGRLAEDFLARLRRGERPAIHEYTDPHPELAPRIREVFPLLAMMERVAPNGAKSESRGARAAEMAQPAIENLGGYHILREIGRGGMGIVYEAEQATLGRHVALKILPSGWHPDASHLQRFQREARAAALLHHTNIVPVFDVGEADGVAYYAMQFIHGLGLDDVLEELRRLRAVRVARERREEEPGRSVSDSGQSDEGRALRAGDEKPGAGAHAPGGNPSKSVTARIVAQTMLSSARGDVGTDEVHAGPIPRDAASIEPAAASRIAGSSASSLHLPGQSDPTTPSEAGTQYWRSVARIGVQVAEALQYAHQHGTLHRDVKPSNLLLDTSGVVWVTDFGLARLEDEGNLTHQGEFVGTLRYMAPERFQGQSDARSDVYSLGLTLYELLTHRPAFDAGARHQLVQQVLHEDPTRPRKVDPTIPRDLETVVLKSIAREPATRYQTAGELAADLERFLEDRPITARKAGMCERAVKWSRRRPAIAGLTAALVLAVALGVSGVVWQWRQALAARDSLQRALAAKSQALAEADAAREDAWRAARRSQQVSAMLQGLFRGGDRVGVSAFFLDLPQLSSESLTAVELLDRGVREIHELDNDPETQAEILQTLGAIYLSLGRLERADALLAKASALRPSGSTPGARAGDLRMLIGLRYFQGRYAEAGALLQEMSQLAPAWEPDFVELFRALLRMEQNETDATILAVEQALSTATESQRHPDPLAVRRRGLILMYLAAIRLRRDEWEPCARLGLEAQRCLFEAQGGRALASLYEPVINGFAKVEFGDRRLAGHGPADRQAGIDMVHAGLEQARQDLGPTHPVLGILLVELARVLEMKATTRNDAWYEPHADPLYRLALEGLLAGCGRQPRAADCMEHLARLLDKRGRQQEAADLLRSALDIRQTVQGDAHAATRRAAEALRRLQLR